MQIDMSLLRDVEHRLNELGPIVTAKEFSKEAIADKIVGIEKSLKKINVLTWSQLKAYHEQKIAWQEKLAECTLLLQTQVRNFTDYTNALLAATDKIIAGEDVELPAQGYDPASTEAAFKAVADELTNIDSLLAENLNIRFTWNRRWIALISWLFFRFNNIAARVISITFTITFAYLAELLLEGYLEKWPKYFVTLTIALGTGFSLDS
jgi:hypothetical protein